MNFNGFSFIQSQKSVNQYTGTVAVAVGEVADAAGEVAGEVDVADAFEEGGRAEDAEGFAHDDVEQIPVDGGFEFVVQFAAGEAVGDFGEEDVVPDVAELFAVFVPVLVAGSAGAAEEGAGEVVRARLRVVFPFLGEAAFFGSAFVDGLVRAEVVVRDGFAAFLQEWGVDQGVDGFLREFCV